MTTCRLLCALLVLALCCCPSVGATASSGDQKAANVSTSPQSQGAGVPGPDGAGSLSGSSTGQTSRGNLTSQQSDPAAGKGHAPSGIPGPTVTVGSKGQGAGTPASLGNDAEQSHGMSGLRLAADPARTVQEQAQITGAGGSGSRITSSKEQTGSGSKTSQGLSSGNGTAQNPGEKEAVGSNKPDGKEPNSGTTTDTVQETGTGSATSTSPDSTSPGRITEQQPSGSANPVQQIQKANAPTTTSTTATAQEASTTTTTTTTTTTRAPSLLRESDGSLSSPAWVCAPLLLAVSALAYTTLG
ncbi:putative mucin TcMUCII [Trypanosoma cruzi]|uniref:Mucin TcMUCII, putative n=2 Tax=Trypanosoma cruzi TaxID=5693 RepID=Q4DUV4_TRYCC|nr:mucin TcMUCII, putative [Trypanosoma cruzi]EAN96287.1 mucin TcMUCII, putative [Trypanosoma cruzi]PWV14712.1 putative mucin TcMUCII [Trypanosoma cruzi]|eukprot:XP_818138.1 mucin TcMUCII [Trypanosoma cruzi strain CL Brener]